MSIFPTLPGDNVSIKITSYGFLIVYDISSDLVDLASDISPLANMVRKAIAHTITSYFSSMEKVSLSFDHLAPGCSNSIEITSSLFGPMASRMTEEFPSDL